MGITVVAAVALVQQRLGFRRDQEQNILNEMDIAQSEEEGKGELPWFLQKVSTFPTVAGTQFYDLSLVMAAPGFLMEIEEDGVHVEVNGNYILMEKEDRAVLREAYTGSSYPKAYAVAGAEWALYPKPDGVYTVEVEGYFADMLPSVSKATYPDATATNKWLTHAPDVLVSKTLLRMATSLNNQKVMATAIQEYQAAATRLHTQTIAKQEIGRYRRMGDMQ